MSKHLDPRSFEEQEMDRSRKKKLPRWAYALAGTATPSTDTEGAREMTTMTWLDEIESLNPCADALVWLRKQHAAGLTAQEVWDSCERGDRMLWLIGRTDHSTPYSDERRPLVALACECARLAWQWMPQESRDALAVFERWSAGADVSRDELLAA